MSSLTSVCYHYLKRKDNFHRIYGHDFNLFKKHIDYYLKNYTIISADDVIQKNFKNDKKYLLLTFDDALKEQYTSITEYLNQKNIKAVFNISTCIFENLPPNPQIWHFSTAYYGIRKFYSFFIKQLQVLNSEFIKLLPVDPDKIQIDALYKVFKNFVKREIEHKDLRQTLLGVYKEHIEIDFPEFMQEIFLSSDDLKKISTAGHTIGAHTHTHPVIQGVQTDNAMFKEEIIKSREILASIINKQINVFAYPFGAEEDILNDPQTITKIKNQYQLILTTYKQDDLFDKFNFGRYLSQGDDNTNDLENNLWSYLIN